MTTDIRLLKLWEQWKDALAYELEATSQEIADKRHAVTDEIEWQIEAERAEGPMGTRHSDGTCAVGSDAGREGSHSLCRVGEPHRRRREGGSGRAFHGLRAAIQSDQPSRSDKGPTVGSLCRALGHLPPHQNAIRNSLKTKDAHRTDGRVEAAFRAGRNSP